MQLRTPMPSCFLVSDHPGEDLSSLTRFNASLKTPSLANSDGLITTWWRIVSLQGLALESVSGFRASTKCLRLSFPGDRV